MVRQGPESEAGRFESSLYRRPSRVRRLGALLLTAGGAFAVACGGSGTATEDPATQWVESDGVAGRINMDDVEQAYKDAYSNNRFDEKKFEQRLNEIFEGDNQIILDVVQNGDVAEFVAWEDLNGDKLLDTATDDKLFTIKQQLKDGGGFETQGHGANNYYYNSSPFGGFFTGLLIGNLLSGGLGGFGGRYTTSPARYDENAAARSSYRAGSGYTAQQARNASFGSGIGSRFGNSTANSTVSPARSSYQQRQINSGAFRSSGSSSRSIGGARGSAPGGGTISGGGGRVAL